MADADAAALLIGRDDPVVRAQLESGGAVALAPSSVVDGQVRIAADPRLGDGVDPGSTESIPGPEADIPAIVVDSPYAPAAVIVAPARSSRVVSRCPGTRSSWFHPNRSRASSPGPTSR